ncbi:hypothetical protein L210DRAFT_891761 [Boletus edulis BED1]|uniref:Uncharacterized protein n=1 Tax=Boletus edulis BED1 TaxID=1328754 RepID=A0AAD4BEE5_BOLED|nr:hypothetical protein L210DRAFT_891761 [Boletus edulis BED1]
MVDHHVADKLYHLDEDTGGYKCPLCPFSGLPFSLYTHLHSHFLPHLPTDDLAASHSDSEESHGPPLSKKRKLPPDTPGTQGPSAVIQSRPSHQNPFAKKPRNDSTQPQHPRVASLLSIQEPSTPSPNPGMLTPPSSLTTNHHRGKGDSLPVAVALLRTGLVVELQSQSLVVSKFLNTHKGMCLLHTLLCRSAIHPHTSLSSCDLGKWFQDSDYQSFRSAFRMENNHGRCASCGCPKIETITHEGSWNGSPRNCKDEDLQDWVLGLAFHTWNFVDLREKVFQLLEIPPGSFESGIEGRTLFARWLGQKNGRDLSWVASNLLDILFVVANNATQLFGRFSYDQEA